MSTTTPVQLTDRERDLLADHVRKLHNKVARRADNSSGDHTTVAEAHATASDLRDLLYRLGGKL